MTTPTAALVEEAERKSELLCAAPSQCQALATALRRAEAERDEARRDAEAYKRQTQEVSAKAIELTKEVSAKLEQAEAERDAQHAEVLRLTGELQQSRKESLERARTVLMLDEDFDEACALGFGLGCMLTNAQWRESDAAERAQRGLKLMQSCLQDEERKVCELTATRDLLTAENARLQKELERARDLRRETLGVRMIDNLTTQLAEVTRQRDEAYDTQFAVMWGYICLGTNTRDVQNFVEVGLPAAARKVKALEDHIATLELLLRGGK